ncbi:unnamed protein product [Caretta caretta]
MEEGPPSALTGPGTALANERARRRGRDRANESGRGRVRRAGRGGLWAALRGCGRRGAAGSVCLLRVPWLVAGEVFQRVEAAGEWKSKAKFMLQPPLVFEEVALWRMAFCPFV